MMLTPCSQCSTVLLIRCATSPYQTGTNGVQHRVGHVCDRRLTKKREEACGWESALRRTRSCGCLSEQTGRKQLLSLYEGPRQILQCTVDHFESFDQCAEVLIGIAQRCAAGHLEANDLQRERDAQMAARGIAAPSRGKKFAANQMPSSSQQKRKAEDSCMDMCDWMSGPMEEDAWF